MFKNINLKMLLIIQFLILFLGCNDNKPITGDDNTKDTVETVTICNQVWMQKNLNVDHYRNGDPIPQVTDSATWVNTTSGAWCYYDNKPANGAVFGKLYNWYAVNDPRGLAPEGWHVPSDEEWKELEMCLGMSQSSADSTGPRGTDEGSKLAGRAGLWLNGALDDNANFGTSGFTGVPGGFRCGYSHCFYFILLHGMWWSSTEYSSSRAVARCLYYKSTYVLRSNDHKEDGFSVRCVRD
jgi:uncharacterized protein (TIGR02145 family)